MGVFINMGVLDKFLDIMRLSDDDDYEDDDFCDDDYEDDYEEKPKKGGFFRRSPERHLKTVRRWQNGWGKNARANCCFPCL